ncbi:MAG: hypothetical protein SWQ30_13340 [Thermodesulfobacteriota bacterium]|nr:hypothetical protein [Thermodesulfobacteriota bacterium]
MMALATERPEVLMTRFACHGGTGESKKELDDGSVILGLDPGPP